MQRHLHLVTLAAAGLGFISLTGCQSSYVNSAPGRAMRAAKAESFSHPIIARAYNAKPAIRFPATIALAPQDHETTQQLRALDATGKIDALKNLPQVSGIANVTSLMYSDSDSQIIGPNGQPQAIWNKSDVLLREAAARLRADAVLIMKIETSVTDGKVFAPLTVLSLGMFPNDRTEVIATALAALVDTRTGYVYATTERSAGRSGLSPAWTSDDVRSRVIDRASRQALEKLFGEIPAVWQGVLAKHRK